MLATTPRWADVNVGTLMSVNHSLGYVLRHAHIQPCDVSVHHSPKAEKATGKYYKMKDKYVGTLINIFGSNVEQNIEYFAFS